MRRINLTSIVMATLVAVFATTSPAFAQDADREAYIRNCQRFEDDDLGRKPTKKECLKRLTEECRNSATMRDTSMCEGLVPKPKPVEPKPEPVATPAKPVDPEPEFPNTPDPPTASPPDKPVAEPAPTPSPPSEDTGDEGTDPYKGLSVRLTSYYMGMLPTDLTRADLFSGGAGFSYRLGIPLSFDADGGVITVLRGGMARHYTQGTDGHTTGYLSMGVAYLPLLSKHVALRIHPKGILLFNGGAGTMLDIGSVFYIGETRSFQMELGSSVGYVSFAKPMGDNPTAPRIEDPILRGLTLGLYGGMGYKFY